MSIRNNKEIWKDIPNYEGLYQVSNLGRVKSLPKKDGFVYLEKERILKPLIVNGRNRVVLCKNKKKKNYYIYQLVAKTFIPNPNNYPIINHINGIPNDDAKDNLEWCTYKHNSIHAVNNNLIKHYKIAQYSLNGELIKIYNSRHEIKNIDQSSITRCCNGKRKTAGGYKWKYVNKNTMD